jgi:hypothetical protein
MSTMDLHLTQHTHLPRVMYKRYCNDSAYMYSTQYYLPDTTPRDTSRSHIPSMWYPTPAWAQEGTQPQPGIAQGAPTQTPSSSRRASPSRPVTRSS